MTDLKRAAYRIHGRVQGVGFRWWCAQMARELGLDGSVRNRPDGSVEVHLYGEVFAVDLMTEHLARGPGLARVSGMEPLKPEPSMDRGFHVLG